MKALLICLLLSLQLQAQLVYYGTGTNTYTIYGLSSETKPASPPDNCLFVETNTGSIYRSSGAAWSLLSLNIATINKVTITAPATSATLVIPDGVTLNAGAGGTLGSNAFNSTSYQPLAANLTDWAGKTAPSGTVLGTTDAQAITSKTIATFNYAADAGSNDTYVISLSPAPAAYTTGMIVIFKANTVNTGAASLNVNSLGAITIVKRVSTTLANADIASQQFCMVVYNGTNFVLMNPTVN